jgi:hypothetical protein
MKTLISMIACAAAVALPSFAMAATEMNVAPESETFMLVLAALGLMATIARRRRKF